MLAVFLIGAALAAQDVTLQAEDGLHLHARVEVSPGATSGVVLLHMLGRQATDMDFLATKLAKTGLTTVAPDLRGHGSSDKAGEELTDGDYLAMIYDVRASVKYLRDAGVTQVSCVGGGLGANLCLQVGSEDKDIVNVVMLSPGLNYEGITSPHALKAYGNRPLLLVASDDDPGSARAATILRDRALGQVHLQSYENAGHGTKMLNREGGLDGIVQSWLLGTYELGTGEVVVPHPDMGVDAESMATEGQKLQSHQ
ncbi:MAG: alpha/beta hydrolase [Oligoflexia bacterium]|nr:alpha/beta hydrolase [Oligoflexia bacterium]